MILLLAIRGNSEAITKQGAPMSAIDVTGTEETVEAISTQLARRGEVVEISSTTALDADRGLRVGLAEAAAAFAFVTVVLKTGSSLLDFLKSLRDFLKARESEEVLTVTDARSGVKIAEVAGSLSDDEIVSASSE